MTTLPLSREARRARRRYWAVMTGNSRRGWTGWAMDFYPEEEIPHYQSLVQQRIKILGTFDDYETAFAVVHAKIQCLCAAHNKRLKRNRIGKEGSE